MTKQSRKKIISLILGIIFTFGILIGHAFNLEGSFRCYFNSTNAMIKTIIVLGGMSSLFAVLLYKVYSFDFWENGVREHNKTSKVNTFIFDKHPWGYHLCF